MIETALNWLFKTLLDSSDWKDQLFSNNPFSISMKGAKPHFANFVEEHKWIFWEFLAYLETGKNWTVHVCSTYYY